MEILAHGTKGGYKSNLNTEKQSTFALGDIFSGNIDEKALGKYFYTLCFKDHGYVFTKYTILRDSLRSKSIGGIGFSLFLLSNKELVGKGKDVISLLDQLTEYYINNYTNDNNINRGEKTLFKEDWNFIDQILSKYQEKNKDTIEETFISGQTKPAFHYYKSKQELIELFDKPYQEEYQEFEQILFIDSNFNDESNPLNVIQNSGIKIEPDLDNQTYYLQNYQSYKNVKITSNGKLRSDKRGENFLKAKWHTRISYTKNERYYKPINEEGTISELTSKGFFEIKGFYILINYNAFNNLEQKKHSVNFTVIHNKVSFLKEVEITSNCKNNKYPNKKALSNSSIDFLGEEMKEKWTAIASYGELSGEKTFTPENYEKIEITIEKRVRINFEVKDEQGNKIIGFEVWTNFTNGFISRDYIEFTDNEIDKTHNITIKKKEYENYEIKDFKPQKNKSIQITLKKAPAGDIIKNGRAEDPRSKSLIEMLDHFFSMPIVIASTIVMIFLLGGSIFYWEFLSTQNGAGTSNPTTNNTENDSSIANINSQNESKPPTIDSSDYPLLNDKNDLKKTSSSNENQKPGTTLEHNQEDNSHKAEVLKYIMGSELDEDTLKSYLNDPSINDDLKKSIQLCIDLWNLKESGGSYSSFQKQIERDKHLNGSKLKHFIDSVVKLDEQSYRAQDIKQGLK